MLGIIEYLPVNLNCVFKSVHNVNSKCSIVNLYGRQQQNKKLLLKNLNKFWQIKKILFKHDLKLKLKEFIYCFLKNVFKFHLNYGFVSIKIPKKFSNAKKTA